MTETLFVISSPLQASHAIQYCTQERIDVGSAWVALVKSRTESDNKKTRSILRAGGFAHVYDFDPLVPSGGVNLTDEGKIHAAAIKDYDDFASRRRFSQSVERFFGSTDIAFDRVVIGDYRPVSYRQFFRWVDRNKTEFVLLDDGAVSQAVMAFRERNAFSSEVFRAVPFHSKFIKEPDPLEYHDPVQLTYFSIYDNKVSADDTIKPNRNYTEFLERVSPRLSDETWIMGCNHVESGIAFEREYENLCMSAKRLFDGRRVLYFPHRREDADKVAKIAFLIGAEVRHTDGVEDFMEATAAVPSSVVSFGSTVLDTVSRMVGTMTACVLLAPPPSYFRGPRREHLERVIQGNVRSNADVVGLFSEDCNASKRWTARRVERAVETPPDVVAPADGCAMSDTALDQIAGFAEARRGSSGALLLETALDEPHSFRVASTHLFGGASRFIAFGLIGEGRSNVRLQVRREDQHDCCVEVDLDLDRDGTYGSRRHGVELLAAVHVDEERRALVRIMFVVDNPGRHEVRVVMLQSGTKAPVTVGDPSIGVSFMDPVEYAGADMSLLPEDARSVIQVRPSDDRASVVRLRIGRRAHDVILRPHPDSLRRYRGQNWTLMACRPAQSGALLNRSTPVIVERSAKRVLLRTCLDELALTLDASDQAVRVQAHDPYSGERRVVEVASGYDAADEADCYVLAC